MQKEQAIALIKVGDFIQWSFPKDHGTFLAGKTFKAKVAVIDEIDKCYGVYAEYGQDYVPFEDATLVSQTTSKQE